MAIASDLERGNYFMYNGQPMRVVRKELVTVGTHCHTKLKFYIQGLYEKGEKAVNFSHTDKVEIVDITRKHGQVVSKVNNKIQVMDMETYETLDAEVEPTLFDEIEIEDNITFIELNGKTIVLEKRSH